MLYVPTSIYQQDERILTNNLPYLPNTYYLTDSIDEIIHPKNRHT